MHCSVGEGFHYTRFFIVQSGEYMYIHCRLVSCDGTQNTKGDDGGYEKIQNSQILNYAKHTNYATCIVSEH